MEENSVFENFELQLNQSAKDFLRETAKWAYFISIMGFVAIGFLILLAVFAGAIFSSMGSSMGTMASSMGSFIGVIYFVMAVLYFFPVYYLFKFASNAKAAFRNNDSEALTNSFEYLKSHYKFLGIFTLIILSIYVLGFGLAILGGLFSR